MKSSVVARIYRFINDPIWRFKSIASRGGYRYLTDKAYLCKAFRLMMGYELNIDNPQTFNEKIQWLKLYDHNPLYTKIADKYEVKEYIASRVGDEYVIPTIGLWEHFEDIDFETLPNQFVLKTTHDSGGVIIVKNKKQLELNAIRRKMNNSLRRNYYYYGREWPYKNIKPRIIAEPYLTNDSRKPLDLQELSDYKFYCFNGEVNCVMICYDRGSGDTKYYFFDTEWNLLRINKRGLNAPENFTIQKPGCLEKMIAVASKLSKGFPFIRIDLYQSNDQVYCGEMTFYPQSGFDNNYLPETDKYFGSLIELSSINTKQMQCE